MRKRPKFEQLALPLVASTEMDPPARDLVTPDFGATSRIVVETVKRYLLDRNEAEPDTINARSSLVTRFLVELGAQIAILGRATARGAPVDEAAFGELAQAHWRLAAKQTRDALH